MRYEEAVSIMVGTAESEAHRRHITEYAQLTKCMIEDLTPQIVQKELEKTYLDLWVKIQTYIN